MSKEYPVLVTGIGGGGHGEQVLKALKLAKLPFRIFGADMSENCANRHAVQDFVTLPGARDPGYLSALKDLIAKHGIRMLIHGSEPEMRLMSENRDQIEATGVYLPVNRPEVLTLCMDKAATFEKLAKLGFVMPAFARLSSEADLAAWDIFPVVIKPSVGGGGSANTFIAQSREELRIFGGYCLSVAPSVVLQEYVGTPAQEYTVGVLFNRQRRLLDSIVVHRTINNALTTRIKVPNRSGKPELGDTLVISSGVSQGQVGRFQAIAEQCEAMAQALEPDGPINIQCRLVDGKVRLFEINPRFSGTSSLRAMCGYNEPETLFRVDVLGEEAPAPYGYKEQLILRNLQENII